MAIIILHQIEDPVLLHTLQLALKDHSKTDLDLHKLLTLQSLSPRLCSLKVHLEEDLMLHRIPKIQTPLIGCTPQMEGRELTIHSLAVFMEAKLKIQEQLAQLIALEESQLLSALH